MVYFKTLLLNNAHMLPAGRRRSKVEQTVPRIETITLCSSSAHHVTDGRLSQHMCRRQGVSTLYQRPGPQNLHGRQTNRSLRSHYLQCEVLKNAPWFFHVYMNSLREPSARFHVPHVPATILAPRGCECVHAEMLTVKRFILYLPPIKLLHLKILF